jgi:hypothetical protein
MRTIYVRRCVSRPVLNQAAAVFALQRTLVALRTRAAIPNSVIIPYSGR